jgi:hypothetical protein
MNPFRPAGPEAGVASSQALTSEQRDKRGIGQQLAQNVIQNGHLRPNRLHPSKKRPLPRTLKHEYLSRLRFGR